jgi:hypothetical protein
MKRLLFCLVLLFSIVTVQAEISCRVAPACAANELEIIGLSATNNAHAETAGTYAQNVCCGDSAAHNLALGTNPNTHYWEHLFDLSGITNAHGATIPTAGYGNPVNLQSTGDRFPYQLHCGA